jgi:hypothetical protein
MAVAALSAPSCIGVHTENVTHGPGRVDLTGYSVEYVDAKPHPGSPVAEGTVVKFSVNVRYSLLQTDRGRLQLQFADQHGQPLLVGKETAINIKRVSSATAELSQEVTIPPERWDLVLYVFVVPEGDSHPKGELRIRYPVTRQRKEAARPSPDARTSGLDLR